MRLQLRTLYISSEDSRGGYSIDTHESLSRSSLAPAAVTVLSIHPSRVAFLGLLCNGLDKSIFHSMHVRYINTRHTLASKSEVGR